MCGIFLSSHENFSSSEKLDIAKNSLRNRGPDDVNIYHYKDKVAMLHTRLAIQDESFAGKQPMFSKKSNNVIIYNGELYNTKYLKSYLKSKYSLKTNSTCDTEILLEGFSLEGKKFLEKIDGIFAFIIFDTDKKVFYIARDKLGIKPLVYSIVKNGLLVASDVNTLFEILDKPLPSKKSIADLLSLTFVPEPNTLFEEIKYFEPGFLFTFELNGNLRLKDKINSSIKTKLHSPKDRLETTIFKLQKEIEESVKSQLISDSRIGLFLSSGIDSSLLLSILAKLDYDLSLAITLRYPSIAKGTDSQESERQASRLIKEISDYKHLEISPPSSLNFYEEILNYLVIEGLTDPAALATYYLSKEARKQGCKVMLAGQGADELFYGYRRHKIITLFLEKISLFIKNPFIFLKLRRFIKLLNLFGNSPNELLTNLYTWTDKKTLDKLLINSPSSSISDEIKSLSFTNLNHNIIEYFDFKYDLKSLNLRYSDRLGMHSSIEVRVPYLSTSLIKYVRSIPTNLKCKFLSTKFILKALSKKYLPRYIINRSKTGFSLPLNSLLFKDKSFIFKILNKKNIIFNQFFNIKEVKNISQEFYENKTDNAQLIFSLFLLKKMFDDFYICKNDY